MDGQGVAAAVTDQRTAILLFLASIGFITVVDTSAKYLTADLHAFEIVWGYFLGIVTPLVIYALAIGAPRRGLLYTGRPVLQIARSGLLVLSIATLFVGLTYLPIAEATAISFMSPLFIVALSGPMLGERVGIHRWVAVVIGLLGVLVIVRPGGGLAHWAVSMPLIGAVAFAAYQLSTRVLAATDTVFATLFYTGVGGFFWTCLLVPFFWTMPSPGQWIAFLAIGSLGVAAHLCLIKAFELAQASLLAPFNYTKLVWAALAGYLVFGDVPSLNTLAGCALIIASGLYVILRERPTPKVTR
jgi:drug/metabolite transporter (DMT)-like permease